MLHIPYQILLPGKVLVLCPSLLDLLTVEAFAETHGCAPPSLLKWAQDVQAGGSQAGLASGSLHHSLAQRQFEGKGCSLGSQMAQLCLSPAPYLIQLNILESPHSC